jgi:hypothetical protein
MPIDPFLLFNSKIDIRFDEAEEVFKSSDASGGWACENYHFNPDTRGEFINGGSNRSCEICGRPRPRGESE